VKHTFFAASAEGLLGNLWLANPMKIMLMKPTFVPNIDTQKLYADISANEVASGGGYTTGGATLVNKTAAYNAASDRTDFYADDPVWGPGATFDAGFAVIYDNSGTKPLWSLVDFEGTKSVAAGTFTLDFPTLGMLYAILV
jgi:hypothetical protein